MKKYWYKEEIEVCVLCGKEKKSRWRVFEKPELYEKVKLIDFACGEHFI